MGRTRIVRWLRVILPLAALAILSVLFLLSRSPEPGAAIPYAEARLEDLGRNAGVSQPRFSTVTADGTTVTLTAARVAPGEAGATARDLALDWTAREGGTARLTADAATQQGATITLTGAVDMALSSGWRLTAPRLSADLDGSRLVAPDAVSVTAPFGTLDAGAMALTRDAGGRQVLELNRGVRLLYRP